MSTLDTAKHWAFTKGHTWILHSGIIQFSKVYFPCFKVMDMPITLTLIITHCLHVLEYLPVLQKYI